MIRKSGNRFSEKIMLRQNARATTDSNLSNSALGIASDRELRRRLIGSDLVGGVGLEARSISPPGSKGEDDPPDAEPDLPGPKRDAGCASTTAVMPAVVGGQPSCAIRRPSSRRVATTALRNWNGVAQRTPPRTVRNSWPPGSVANVTRNFNKREAGHLPVHSGEFLPS